MPSFSDDELEPVHHADAAALRKLRNDDASGVLKKALAERAAQRRAEEDFRRREIEKALDTKPGAALEADASRDAAPKAAAAPKTTDGAGAAATPANSQEIAASLKNIESKLDEISDRPGPCCTVA